MKKLSIGYVASISPMKGNEYTLRKATKNMKSPKIHIPPIRNVLDNWTHSEGEKTEIFAQFFVNSFKSNDNI